MPTPRDPDAPTPPEAGMLPPPPDSSPPHDGLLLPLVHDLTKPYIDAGLAHGPLPRLRSDEWLDAHPDQQLAHLLICGIAAIVHHPHQTAAALLKSAATDIAPLTDDPSYISGWDRMRSDLRRAHDELRSAHDRIDRLTTQLQAADARTSHTTQQNPAA